VAAFNFTCQGTDQHLFNHSTHKINHINNTRCPPTTKGQVDLLFRLGFDNLNECKQRNYYT